MSSVIRSMESGYFLTTLCFQVRWHTFCMKWEYNIFPTHSTKLCCAQKYPKLVSSSVFYILSKNLIKISAEHVLIWHSPQDSLLLGCIYLFQHWLWPHVFIIPCSAPKLVDSSSLCVRDEECETAASKISAMTSTRPPYRETGCTTKGHLYVVKSTYRFTFGNQIIGCLHQLFTWQLAKMLFHPEIDTFSLAALWSHFGTAKCDIFMI